MHHFLIERIKVILVLFYKFIIVSWEIHFCLVESFLSDCNNSLQDISQKGFLPICNKRPAGHSCRKAFCWSATTVCSMRKALLYFCLIYFFNQSNCQLGHHRVVSTSIITSRSCFKKFQLLLSQLALDYHHTYQEYYPSSCYYVLLKDRDGYEESIQSSQKRMNWTWRYISNGT